MQAMESLPTTGTVLGIDPGGAGRGHTGIVWLQYTEDRAATLLDSWAVPDGLEGFVAWAEDHNGGAGLTADNYLDPTDPIVVCETFVNRNIPGVDLTPVLVEGAVRALFRDVVLQPASGKNMAVPDDVLARLGLLDIGKDDHHRDRREAARHAIRFLKNHRHLPTLLVGWPKTTPREDTL